MIVEAGTATVTRISVIIANYNYERYVGRAIESALDLDWPDVEVIVVDDGSTDGSREVIDRYRDRGIKVLFQDNSTQRVARNRGYEMSTGEVIIHLDSDDVLFPSIGREIADVWNPSISKIQFQMMRIDEHGNALESVFPSFRQVPTAADIRRWAETTSSYPTPPGSGNAYSRAFLDEIFPLDDSCGAATDSYCLAAAPFLGDVVTVAKPLVGYRLHGANVSNMTADLQRFPKAVERARARYLYQLRFSGGDVTHPDERPLFRARHLLQLRIAARKTAPDARPLPGDSWGRMFLGALCSPFWPGSDSVKTRVLILGWCVMTLLAPASVAEKMVRRRFRQRT